MSRRGRIPNVGNPGINLISKDEIQRVNPPSTCVDAAPGAAFWRRHGARRCAHGFLLATRAFARAGGELKTPAPQALLSRFLAGRRARLPLGAA